jgi:hypothetical protein
MAQNWKYLGKPHVGPLNQFSSFIAREEWKDPELFGDVRPANNLVISFDSSGSHPNSRYEAFSFLFLRANELQRWSAGKNLWRRELPVGHRKLSYKTLNDRRRVASLPSFLSLADTLHGSLVTFAIHKELVAELYRDADFQSASPELGLDMWSRRTRRRLITMAHLCGMTTSCMTHDGQSVIWIFDQDDIFANDRLHIQASRVFSWIANHYLSHKLWRAQIATTKSDTGNFDFEDISAIADLAAGACCDFVNAHTLPDEGSVLKTPLTLRTGPKTNVLLHWIFSKNACLRKTLFLWDRSTKGQKRFAKIDLHGQPYVVALS